MCPIGCDMLSALHIPFYILYKSLILTLDWLCVQQNEIWHRGTLTIAISCFCATLNLYCIQNKLLNVLLYHIPTKE